MPLFSHQDWQPDNEPRARVDESGHIYINDTHKELHSIPEAERTSRVVPTLKHSQWEITEEDEVIQHARKQERTTEHTEQLVHLLKGVRGTMLHTAQSVLNEGKNQYAHSYQNIHFSFADLRNAGKKGMQNTWQFLTQPVWVMRKNKSAKEYSRGTLFILDAVRFGGTFSAIFVGLFITLNYQSFFQIVSPYLDPIERAASANGEMSAIDNTLKEKLLKSPMLATAGTADGDLLSYLPDIGPPENRVIIPKLGLNIPLVTPSYSSLLKEDWDGVETDIQDALKHGVVHYPGTARPGQAGNFFVTGHSSYYPWSDGHYKTIFARLHELEVGDEYWAYYGGDKHRYVITSKKEVKPSDVTVLDQPTNRRTGTLMTCTPVGTTLRRLILQSQEIDIVTGKPLKVGEQETRPVHDIIPQSLSI